GTGEAKSSVTGTKEIRQVMVRPLLNPLSIQKTLLFLNVHLELVSRIGIRLKQALADMPVKVLHRMARRHGIDLGNRANGIDNHPLAPYTERKSLSTEHTFSQDTIDITDLKALISGMVEKLSYQLRAEQWLTSTVVVKIRY